MRVNGSAGASPSQFERIGMINEDQMRRALVRQTHDLVYEVVRWKEFEFELFFELRVGANPQRR